MIVLESVEIPEEGVFLPWRSFPLWPQDLFNGQDHFPPSLFGFDAIIERKLFLSDDLIIFMTFSSDENRVQSWANRIAIRIAPSDRQL